MEEMVALARQAARPAHHIDSAKLAEIGRDGALSRDRRMVGIELHISRNKQIEPPVVVVIAPGRARGPASQRHACLLGDVGKSTVVVVVIEAVAAIVSHVDVGPAIIVVVAHSHAKSPALVADAGLVGDISKCPIVIVVKEHGAGRGLLALEGRDRGTVQKIDVEPAVVVVVEQRDARTRSLDNRTFFPRAGTMMKLVQSGLLSDVRKYDRCAVHKATCRDGARLRVLDRGPGGAGRDSHICRGRLLRLRLLAVSGNRKDKDEERKKNQCVRGQAQTDVMDLLWRNRLHRKLANL